MAFAFKKILECELSQRVNSFSDELVLAIFKAISKFLKGVMVRKIFATGLQECLWQKGRKSWLAMQVRWSKWPKKGTSRRSEQAHTYNVTISGQNKHKSIELLTWYLRSRGCSWKGLMLPWAMGNQKDSCFEQMVLTRVGHADSAYAVLCRYAHMCFFQSKYPWPALVINHLSRSLANSDSVFFGIDWKC